MYTATYVHEPKNIYRDEYRENIPVYDWANTESFTTNLTQLLSSPRRFLQKPLGLNLSQDRFVEVLWSIILFQVSDNDQMRGLVSMKYALKMRKNHTSQVNVATSVVVAVHSLCAPPLVDFNRCISHNESFSIRSPPTHWRIRLCTLRQNNVFLWPQRCWRQDRSPRVFQFRRFQSLEQDLQWKWWCQCGANGYQRWTWTDYSKDFELGQGRWEYCWQDCVWLWMWRGVIGYSISSNGYVNLCDAILSFFGVSPADVYLLIHKWE